MTRLPMMRMVIVQATYTWSCSRRPPSRMLILTRCWNTRLLMTLWGDFTPSREQVRDTLYLMRKTRMLWVRLWQAKVWTISQGSLDALIRNSVQTSKRKNKRQTIILSRKLWSHSEIAACASSHPLFSMLRRLQQSARPNVKQTLRMRTMMMNLKSNLTRATMSPLVSLLTWPSSKLLPVLTTWVVWMRWTTSICWMQRLTPAISNPSKRWKPWSCNWSMNKLKSQWKMCINSQSSPRTPWKSKSDCLIIVLFNTDY